MTPKGRITKVEVVDKEDNAQIIMNFKKEEFNKKFDKEYFELSSLLKINQENNKKIDNPKTEENKEENQPSNANEPKQNANDEKAKQNESQEEKQEEVKTKTTTSINDIVYPMYLPNNTYLTNQEKINTKEGERLILTFGGDSSFILVEETSKIENENIVIPVSGEFDFLTDVIGIIKTHSLSWHSNGIDYYIASDVIETSELIDIARSISVLPVSK